MKTITGIYSGKEITVGWSDGMVVNAPDAFRKELYLSAKKSIPLGPGYLHYPDLTDEAQAGVLLHTLFSAITRTDFPLLEPERFNGSITKHMGPGDHPSGSSQDVHGQKGQKLYHVSRPSNRDSILAEGLRLSDVDRSHVWTVDNLAAAERIRPGFNMEGDTDIWEVDVEGLNLSEEFHGGLAGNDKAATVVLHDVIGPERLRLVTSKHYGPGPHPSGTPQSSHGRLGLGASPSPKSDTSYRGQHQPSADYGAPAHDLSQIVNEDIYTHPEWYFSMSEGYNRIGAKIVQRIRGNPEADVEVFRAVPADVGDEINPGDWVTTVRSYATVHGDASIQQWESLPPSGPFDSERDFKRIGPGFKILSRTVKAKELMWPADSMVEFGWFPKGTDVAKAMRERIISKHMGPGPHPSGSPQTVHRGGMSVGTQQSLIGELHPHPAIKTSFRLAEKSDFVVGEKFRPASRPFSPEEISSIKLAVEEFEAAHPGLLPPDLEFIHYRSPGEQTGAWTWTPKVVRDKGGAANAVFINEYYFSNPKQLEAIFEDFNMMSVSMEDGAVESIRTRIMFHELAHIAEIEVDQRLRKISADWENHLPHYSMEWYVERVDPMSDLVPSAYAADSRSEFLAEALADVWYNKDTAAPMSKLTASQFKLLAAGEVGEAEKTATRWKKETYQAKKALP